MKKLDLRNTEVGGAGREGLREIAQSGDFCFPPAASECRASFVHGKNS